MTGPIYDPSPNNPRKNWLLRYLGVQQKYDAIIATALLDAADDASRRITDLVGDGRIGSSTRRFQLQLARRAIRETIKILFADLYKTIQDGQKDAALAALEAGWKDDRRVLNRLFRNRTDRGRWEDSMRQGAVRGVQSMMTRILSTNKPLSQRVYYTRSLANGSVDKIINSSLATGGSPYELAKAVRGSIRPDTPGGVGYAAKRLGRTEVNNAFHAQAINDVREKPWVNSVKWNLSKVHVPRPGDKCELYDGQIFGKDEVPEKPHPQCMCYITPQLDSWDSVEANIIAGLYDDYIDNNL